MAEEDQQYLEEAQPALDCQIYQPIEGRPPNLLEDMMGASQTLGFAKTSAIPSLTSIQSFDGLARTLGFTRQVSSGFFRDKLRIHRESMAKTLPVKEPDLQFLRWAKNARDKYTDAMREERADYYATTSSSRRKDSRRDLVYMPHDPRWAKEYDLNSTEYQAFVAIENLKNGSPLPPPTHPHLPRTFLLPQAHARPLSAEVLARGLSSLLVGFLQDSVPPAQSRGTAGSRALTVKNQ